MSSQGEYLNKHGKCHFCDATCEACSGPEREQCTSCPLPRFFDDGRCDIRCRSGRFPTGRQCHLCHHTCKECTDEGPDSCTSCERDKFGEARYLFRGECREACPEAFFHSPQGRCDPCPSDCVVCTAAHRCLNCAAGLWPKNGLCVPLECSAGAVADPEKENCVPCEVGCAKCERKAHQEQETRCLKCQDTFYQLGADCHRLCPDGTYSVSDRMVCVPCEDKRCDICDEGQCYLCRKGFYVFDGECVQHCKEGYFVDEESQECEPCHRTCRKCGGPGYNDCDACEEGFTLKAGECLEPSQLDPCPEKRFRSKQGKCELCHSSCRTCFGAEKENCISCPSGHSLTPRQSCSSHCPPGTFANLTSGRCEDCSRGCTVCRDGKQCLHCGNKLYLSNGECVAECPSGFPDGSVCHPCLTGCASCQGNASHCLSCEMQYLLLDHSCRSHCPQGHYAKDGVCQRCPAHCRECNHYGLCQKCEDYYFLYEDKCVDDCPTGFFASERQQECEKCHRECASCDGPDSDDCDVCRNPKAVRFNGECLSSCPSHTYYDKPTNECRYCDPSCLSCSGHEPSSCLTCEPKRHKDASGHCVWYSQCSLHSYEDQSGKCQLCDDTCHRCTGPGADRCLNCNDPLFLLNSTCVKECPEGYYADKDERMCERCHFSCKSCSGRHSVQCNACKPGFFKQGSICVETCSDSHFGNTTTMTCDHCDPSCSRCRGRGNRECLGCREGYLYLKQWEQCLKNCPPGFYHHSFTHSCRRCHATCKTCKDEGALACDSCYDGFVFVGRSICQSKCLIGFYDASQGSRPLSDQVDCRPCDASCMDCRGPGEHNCTVCPALQILADDGRCLSCCGEQEHDDEPISRECCDCTSSLEECIMGVNFVMKEATDLDIQSSGAKSMVTLCVFLVLCVGAGVYVFLQTRVKPLLVSKTNSAGGYEKLDNGGPQSAAADTFSSFGEYSDRIRTCEEEEEDDEDDIVYILQDGTVCMKSKYRLMEEDDIELEYDDEGFSYR